MESHARSNISCVTYRYFKFLLVDIFWNFILHPSAEDNLYNYILL